jgi:obg-like ATPase 1
VAALCVIEHSIKRGVASLQVLAWLEEGKDVRLGDWTAREIEFLNNWLLLTAKPAVYLVNCSKKDYIRKKNKFLPKIFEWVQANGGAPIIPFSGVFENEVRLLRMLFRY